MNIALVGYGKMGHEIEKICLDKGHTVTSTIDPYAADATHTSINEDSLKGADVVIDFTAPDTALGNIDLYVKHSVNVVFGTTGWYDSLDVVQKKVTEAGIGFIWSGNFSIGVNLFFRIIADACKKMDHVKEYDSFAYELHHNQKKDSPSGTAEMIGSIMLDNLSSKKTIVREKLDRQIEPGEVHVASVRGGNIPGTHVVGFDSPADTIELKHTARSRQGFALGAVLAAEWIKEKKGFFGIEEFMDSLVK